MLEVAVFLWPILIWPPIALIATYFAGSLDLHLQLSSAIQELEAEPHRFIAAHKEISNQDASQVQM